MPSDGGFSIMICRWSGPIVRDAKVKNYSFSTVMLGIVKSVPFQMRAGLQEALPKAIERRFREWSSLKSRCRAECFCVEWAPPSLCHSWNPWLRL